MTIPKSISRAEAQRRMKRALAPNTAKRTHVDRGHITISFGAEPVKRGFKTAGFDPERFKSLSSK